MTMIVPNVGKPDLRKAERESEPHAACPVLVRSRVRNVHGGRFPGGKSGRGEQVG